MKTFKIAFIVLLASAASAQQSLKVQKGVQFQLTGDIFLLDSLVMEDNSILLLDPRHKSCVIRARFLSAGDGVIISGIGRNGEAGRDGSDGSARALDVPGKDGTAGTPGVNLTINFLHASLQSQLEIDVHGGRGGDGGTGGSFVQRPPNNAAQTLPDKGLGGSGGDGGNGGNVIISLPSDLEKIATDKITIHTQGGKGGSSGTPSDVKATSAYYQNERNGADGLKGKIQILHLER